MDLGEVVEFRLNGVIVFRLDVFLQSRNGFLHALLKALLAAQHDPHARILVAAVVRHGEPAVFAATRQTAARMLVVAGGIRGAAAARIVRTVAVAFAAAGGPETGHVSAADISIWCYRLMSIVYC